MCGIQRLEACTGYNRGVEVTIEVLGVRALGRHGVLPEEQERAQPFEIDLRLRAEIEGADSDELVDTVDYATIAEAVARVVELESYQLLERLADRIASICLFDPRVVEADVSVRKQRPPLPVHVSSVGLRVTRRRAS